MAVTRPPGSGTNRTYVYTDVAGQPLFRVVRRPGKQFHQEHYENGVWHKGLGNVPRVLYNLPAVLEAAGRGGTIWVCYSPDTEVLTKNGWVTLPALDNQRVAQYSRHTSLVSFVKPSARQIFRYQGDMIPIRSDFCDLLVTPDHRVLRRFKKTNGELTEPSVVRAADVRQQNWLPVAGFRNGNTSGLTPDEAQLLAAWQADGVNTSRGYRVGWNIKKNRKKKRLRSLLGRLGIEWREQDFKSNPGWLYITIDRRDVPLLDRELPGKLFHWGMLDWPLKSRIAFLKELGYWDGDHSPSGHTRYFTEDRDGADIVSAIAATSGWGSIVRKDTHRENPQYVVNLVPRDWRGVSNRNPPPSEPSTGRVYCLTVPTGFIITRRNGKVTICGNCEGERDADALIAQGIPATTNPGGAGKWRDEYVNVFRGVRRVNVIWDNDVEDPKTGKYPGQAHALAIESSLNAAGIPMRFMRALEGNDLSDHLEAGHGLPELVKERPGDPLPTSEYAAEQVAALKVEPAVYQLAVVRLHEHAQAKGLALPKKTDKGWEACCPSHDDRSASLGIMIGDDQPLVVKCQAGCELHEIAAAMRIDLKEFSEFKPQYDAALEREIQNQRVRTEARIIIAAESLPVVTPPELPPAEYMIAEDAEDEYTIEKLHINGANTLIVASFKTGKTRMAINLFRSLVNQEPFLGKFQVTTQGGRVAYLDYEMLETQFRMWLKADGAINVHRMTTPWHLRGNVLAFWHESVRKQLVSWLRANDVSVLIIDTAARAWSGLVENENSNSEILRFTDSLDQLKFDAGVNDLFLITHMGRQSQFAQEGEERARGATRLEDWMDTGWYLTKDKTGTRYMRANGRGVDVESFKLTWHPTTGRLTTTGILKREHEQRTAYEIIVDTLSTMSKAPTTTELGKLMPVDANKKSSLLLRAETDGLIERRHPPGTPGTTKLVYLTEAGLALHNRKVTPEES